MVHHDGRQVGQRRHLIGRHRPGLAVDHAQHAKLVTTARDQRMAGIEPQAERPGDQRVVAQQRFGGHIVQNQGAILKDRRGAQPDIAIHLAEIEAVTRFEPDPVPIDQADDGDRRSEQPRRHRRDMVQSLVRRRVEDIQTMQRRQSRRLVLQIGCHDRHHLPRI